MSYRWLLVVFLSASSTCFIAVEAFTPTKLLKLLQFAPSSQTHKSITREAHVAVAQRLVSEHPNFYPGNPTVMLSRAGFRQAAGDLQKAVTEPDFGVYRAGEHFDAEQFDEGNRIILDLLLQIRQDIRAGSMMNARRHAGLALHTIQDFYSHSNWIEIQGRAAVHPQVGVENMGPIGDQAGTEDVCCNDKCTGTDRTKKIDIKNKLSSGYFKNSLNGEGELKPTGKCSHGGPLDRTSWSTSASGINKDTTSSFWSPRKSLHYQAADAAFEASVRFLNSINKNPDDAIGDQQFSEFIGLMLGKTLCFIIDTTGSMAYEIEAIRAVTSGMITATIAAAGGELPGDYLLVPFNDPGYGPALKTTDPKQMLDWLKALKAYGGGDEPENIMHGIQLAIDHVTPGSTCYVYTDSSAKDGDMFPYVSSNAVQRKVKFIQFLTDIGIRRRRRSTSHQNSSSYTYYDHLVEMTGGSMYHIKKSDSQIISEFVVGMETRESQVVLFTSTSNINYLFAQVYVDQTVKDVYLMLSGAALSNFSGIQVTSPSGVPSYEFNQTLDSQNVKGYNLTCSTPGRWSINASFPPGHSLSAAVTSTSIVSFVYQFTIEEDGAHAGYRAIMGNPMSGTDYVIVVTVFGAIDPMTGNSTELVRDVTSLQFSSMAGDVVAILPLTEVEHLVTYVVPTRVPSTAFRVALRGIDSGGNVIQRYDTVVIEPRVIQITANVTALSRRPGSSASVDVSITSLGSLSTWYLFVHDTGSFYTGPPTRALSSGLGVSENVGLNFVIPSNASYGYVSTVTVTVGSKDPTGIENFYLFYLTVERPVNDVSSPVIVLNGQVFPCNETDTALTSSCSLYTWTTQFQVNDVDSGLRSLTVVRSVELRNSSYVDVEPFTEGTQKTISGNFTSTCCQPTATLLAIDCSGHVTRALIGRGAWIGTTMATRSGSETTMMKTGRCCRWLPVAFAILCGVILRL